MPPPAASPERKGHTHENIPAHPHHGGHPCRLAPLNGLRRRGNTFKLKARLFGDTLVSGHAVYLEKDRGRKGLERRFKVQVEDARSGETFD
ncbi:MAG: hypothetical protein ACYSU2_04190, partial [Planctomycetota bacterium]